MENHSKNVTTLLNWYIFKLISFGYIDVYECKIEFTIWETIEIIYKESKLWEIHGRNDENGIIT